MHFLKKMKQFKVDGEIMALFYNAVIQSSIFFNNVCYYGNALKQDKAQLERIVADAIRITKKELKHPTARYEAAVLTKTRKIQEDRSHPLHDALKKRAPKRDTSKRMRSFEAGTERFRNSFLPTAVRHHNARVTR